MRYGVVVPRLTHEECLENMYECLRHPDLHIRASQGFRNVGQSIDLSGSDETFVCREAGHYWNEETSDKFKNMRHKIDFEMAAVAE